jgi:phosphoribosylamine-glycine ligase
LIHQLNEKEMLPSLRLAQEKAEKHNARLLTDKAYAKKFRTKLEVNSCSSFSDSFSSIQAKDAFLEKRDQAKRQSISNY